MSAQIPRRFILLALAALGGIFPAPAPAQDSPAAPKPYDPGVKPASGEGEAAIKKFVLAPGLRVELFAEEPRLANPVAFTIDHRGRFFIAETFRHHAGVTDMRGYTKWLDDDLAARTTDDRLAAMKKNLGLEFLKYNLHHERVRLVEDRDGDGKADHDSVFADGFNDPLDGIGAGVLMDRGNLYFTCIPHLWAMRDDDGDGRADSRKSLSSGYGVHIGYLGHDLHGLVKGPDGKIYFSIGDRGARIPLASGAIDLPDTGAVFRCEPDGSQLEVVHTGLRNPQELAFDDFGNLFTGDNNSDGGDKARLVYVVEGGDSGWTYGWQWIARPNQRGPWNAEKMWHPQTPEQPAYIVPPLANIGSGPSGFAFYPGTGLPAEYARHFFMCDFRGASATSLIHAFRLEPKGASFEPAGLREFVKGVLVTDAGFGPQGGLYLTDWTEGWDQPKKGRIYRIFSPGVESEPRVLETKQLLAEGMEKRPVSELISLLGHADQRVRLEAQWALADPGTQAEGALIAAAFAPENLIARLHAVWGLGQIGARAETDPGPRLGAMIALLASQEPEVRAQAAKVLGQWRAAQAAGMLIGRLGDDNARVRFFSAIALGRIGEPRAVEPLLAMARANADADPYLRHAAVMGLAGSAGADRLLEDARDPSPAARMAILLALRRMKDPRIALFLSDADPRLTLEAARAINDLPIEAAMPALADYAGKPELIRLAGASPQGDAPFYRRVLNANFRLGAPENARALARMAAMDGLPLPARTEALGALQNWMKPSGRETIVGLWRPLGERPAGAAAEALAPEIEPLLLSRSEPLQTAAAELAAQYGIESAAEPLRLAARSERNSPAARMQALRAMEKLNAPGLSDAVALARASESPSLRREGNALLAKIDPAEAVRVLAEALNSGSTDEKQGAAEALGLLKSPDAEVLLAEWVDRMIRREVPAEIELELIEAARRQGGERLEARVKSLEQAADSDDPAAAWHSSLAGGDAARGEKIFFEKVETSCQRCHTIGARGGGEAGPELTKVGGRLSRAEILESILLPNRKIAEGFENVTLELDSGEEKSGRVVREDAKEIELEIPIQEEAEEFIEGDGSAPAARPKPKLDPSAPPVKYRREVVPAADVKSRKRNLSAMPEDVGESLSKGEMRDLVEFLAAQK